MRLFVPAASELLTDHLGHGEGLITWNILSRLAARGHAIVACARQVALNTDAGFEVIETGPASRFESIEPLAYSLKVTKELRHHGGARAFDAALWLMPQGPANLTWAAPRGLPIVIGPLSPAWPIRRKRPKRKGDIVRAALFPSISTLHQRAIAKASTVLLSTPAAAAAVPRATSEGRTQLVPFGIDLDRFNPQPLPRVPTIAFIGRLERLKGIDELLEAFQLTRSRLPECRLIFAGDGSERAKLRRIAEQSGDSIEVLSHIPNSHVPDLLSRSSVFCLPSHGEPFGMAILEAMAAGRAVVSTDAGGPSFLIEHGRGGALVVPGDASALADALSALLSDPDELRKMGEHNRCRVEASFTWDICVDAIEGALFKAAA